VIPSNELNPARISEFEARQKGNSFNAEESSVYVISWKELEFGQWQVLGTDQGKGSSCGVHIHLYEIFLLNHKTGLINHRVN